MARRKNNRHALQLNKIEYKSKIDNTGAHRSYYMIHILWTSNRGDTEVNIMTHNL